MPGVWLMGREELGMNSMSSWRVGRGPRPEARFGMSRVLLEELDSLVNSPLPLLGFCTD